MIFVPTRGRPTNLRRFLTACLKTGVTTKVAVRIDEDDPFLPEYGMTLDGWANLNALKVIDVVGPPLGFGGKTNDLFKRFPNEKFYACLQDDIVPKTHCWDEIMAEACVGGIASPNDGYRKDDLPTNPFIDGDLARKLGYLAIPNCYHWFIDNAWRDIAKAIGKFTYVPDVLLEHHHWVNDKAPMDETYAGSKGRSEEDQQAYNLWRGFELPRLVERLA